jgi:diguanylate cyclase (GGDEF)-like protein
MKLSLRVKILLLIAGTATGLASVILLAFTLLVSREMARGVREDVRATGGVLGQLMRERSAVLLDQSRLIADQPVLRAALSTQDPATILDRARDYRKTMAVDEIIVTDRDGHVLGDTDGQSRPRADLSRDVGIAAALDNRPWQGIVGRAGHLMLAVSVPVKIGAYPWGTFTAYRAIDQSIAASLQASLGTDVAFLYRGQVVVSSSPLPTHLPTPSVPTVVTLNGIRFFALYASLPDTLPSAGMGFVTLRPYGPAMHLYHRCLLVFLIATALTLLLALGVGTFVARGLTRPLDGVVQAAETLRRGDWPVRFEVRRTDEIGLLQTVFNDMTVSLRGSQERLLALIDADPLTGLDNHRKFQERLAQEAKRCARSGESLSLLLLDLDHFGQYNQKHGHAAGDLAVCAVAEALRVCLPEVAITARYAGEEFAVLLPQSDLAQAETIAEVIRAGVEGLERGLTLSVGCAEFGTQTSQAKGLVLAAELAVSRAKQLGRNRVCRFDSVPGADVNADPYQLHRFLKDESLATIQALAAAVDAKDPYTQGHSKRVAQYAVALAQSLGMTDAEVDLIHITGTLHDVGKIGVPDAILKKPGRLEAEERQVMETHPALGEVIVRKAPQLAATLPGVRHHHERWDGKGYPDGLQNEQIPQMARILAVADTFDAMTSDRPYRKGLSWEIALEEIARGAGTQFEPQLAVAFVTLMQADLVQTDLAVAQAA